MLIAGVLAPLCPERPLRQPSEAEADERSSGDVPTVGESQPESVVGVITCETGPVRSSVYAP